MTSIDTDLLQRYRAAVAVVAEIPADVASYRAADDATLLEINGVFAASQRLLGAAGTLIAGEIAHRSAPELGSRGLAQRTGFRTPEEFVRATTRSTGREAVTAVRIGRLIHETATAGQTDPATGEVMVPTQPWLAPVVEALSLGMISPDSVEAIRSGLGSPNSSITGEQLAMVATQLSVEAENLDPDRLRRRARQVRDELDEAGISIREEERRQQRSLHLFALPSRMGRLVWTMDPETFATVKTLYDRAVSPKLGGVRFVSGNRQKQADRILADPRTPQQLGSDTFAQLLRAGADADSSQLLGSGAPILKIIATRSTIDAREGHGWLEGRPDPVSIATVERLGCAGDTVEVGFAGDGQPLDVGREQRFYTRRQRIALAVRDGGCRWPGCDRPPSWTEAHHTRYWARDRGKTDIADGLLLCRHHHLLSHNNHWEIRHRCAEYWLIPPPGIDPHQKPVPLPSTSMAIRDLQHEQEHEQGRGQGRERGREKASGFASA